TCARRYATSSDVLCTAADSCGEPSSSAWTLWARPEGGIWMPVSAQCSSERPSAPTAGEAPRPTITPGMILEQVRTLGLPTAKIQIQPASETLVNFETIFYTDEPSFDRSIDLLGYQVNIVASPVTYTWHTGDGSTLSTSGPGSPYPDKEIVHRYRDAHVTVHPRVDITYRVK